MTAAAAQAEVLGRLLVIQQTVDALPDETRIAEFTRRALMQVPGVAEVLICLRGRMIPPDAQFQELCAQCERAWTTPSELDWSAMGESDGVHYFPLRTVSHLFGFLVVRVADPEVMGPYLDFLGNITNAVGMVLDSRLYQSRLTDANDRPRNTLDELEIRVAERTRELTARNRALTQEIEERKRLAEALEKRERRLYDLAHYDQLTGLLTQEAFVEGLFALVGSGAADEMAAVIAITIEQFGRLEDSLGYRGTEEVIKAVASRLKSAAAPTDLVAHARGERFYVGIVGLRDMDELERRVRAIIGSLETVFTVEGQKFALQFRVGIALHPVDASDMDTLVLRAEAAAHLAQASRSRMRPVYYSLDLAERSRRCLMIEEGLREAVAAEQFFMVFQPRGNLAGAKVVGAESLLRWRHPTLGNVSPGEFVPIAEESGVIGEMGVWVIGEVCRQIAAWRDQGAPVVPVSLNLTMHDVLSPDTIKALVAESNAAAIPLNLIEVEITESTAMLDAEATKAFLGALRELGVLGIVDDFGTGYSSLAYLLDLPFSMLKIDKRFVDRIQEEKGKRLIQGIVAMAKSLDYRLVAEGVEYEYQAAFLRGCEVETIQGYLYSRPLSAAGFADFLRANRSASSGQKAAN